MKEPTRSELETARLRERWNRSAESYHQWIPFLREQYAPATDLMLDLARLSPGSRVLDVAAGEGDQSLLAAERVGPTGYILATDLAEDILAIAGRSARKAGLVNVDTRRMDAQRLNLPASSFDAVICRFGLGFFPDPDRALAEARRVLRSGGMLSLAIGAAGGSPQWSLASSVIRCHLERPASASERAEEGGLGEPGVLQGKLEAAGFADVEVHTVSVPLRLASLDELKSYLAEWYPAAREALALLSADKREAALEEAVLALSAYETEGRFEIPNQVLVAAGRSD